ncbi:hypothetical protein KF728_09325 [Candidatus Obscuribacterales bacterium]|nr:hypothetical protein [Candidatus Obscuribacterales bacterium]
MRKLLFATVTLGTLVLCLPASAGEKKTTTFYGYLVDRKCSASVREDPHPEEFIKHHTKDCSLMANCKRQGYALFVKSRWLNLDKQGNKHAIKLLERSKRNSGFYVRATGSIEGGDLLKVQTLSETEEPSADQNDAETK